MVDLDSRAKFADLISRFMNREMTSTQFFESDIRYNSIASADRALKAIDGMLWHSYSEDLPHRLEGKHALKAEGIAFYNRCLLFLGSNLEYEWPEEGRRFFQISRLGPVARILTLGLSYFVDQMLERRTKLFLDEYKKAGDYDVWPFIRKSDYEDQRRRSEHI